MEDKDFDKNIAQKLSERTLDVSDNTWERLSAQLPETKKIGLPKFWWVAAVLIMGIFMWSPWKKDSNIPVTDVEVPVIVPETKTEIPTIISDQKTARPLVENTKKPVVKNVQTSPKTFVQKSVLTQKEKAENMEEPTVQTGLATIASQKTEIRSDENDITNALAQNTQEDYHKLILSQIKESNPTYRINANDLLEFTESEMANEKQRPIKEVIFQKFKNTVKDLNVALR